MAKRYNQQEGLDYHEIFSPIAKMVTVRSVIALAVGKDWSLYQMDVFNAFLQGDLLEEVYMDLPQGINLSEEALQSAKPALTPLEVNQKLTIVEYDRVTEIQDKDPLANANKYQKLIGKLLYLTVTRPDISYAVQTLSQFMQLPKKSYMEAAFRLVRYLKATPGMGVLLKRGNVDTLTVFSDLDWEACPMTQRSVSRYAVKLDDLLISWKSKKQHTVSLSSAKAEYLSMAL
ncbi:secreted RxLR effector protein 161-like [Nicotiana sylvestris]|uniref:secreted RxLR effector protein 161-like n=1 Tax=Nicotiana sylvestris TaxID=4096 RepID=UPI00388CBD67